MEENQYQYMNKYIDVQPMFLNWEMDTIIWFVVGFGGVNIFDGAMAIVSLAIGVGYGILNDKMKNSKYRNFVMHIFYMVGFKQPKKRLPPSYKRYFLS